MLRRRVWSRNIKNRRSIYIYIYDISSLRVNEQRVNFLPGEEERGSCNAVCFITQSFCELVFSTTECPAGLLAHTTVTNCHYYRCIEATVSTIFSHIWQYDLQVSSSKVTLTRGSDGSDLTRNRHLTDDSSIGSYKYEVSYFLATFSWTCTSVGYELTACDSVSQISCWHSCCYVFRSWLFQTWAGWLVILTAMVFTPSHIASQLCMYMAAATCCRGWSWMCVCVCVCVCARACACVGERERERERQRERERDVVLYFACRVQLDTSWVMVVTSYKSFEEATWVVWKVLGLDHSWQHYWQIFFFPLSWYICHKHPYEIAGHSIK